MAELPLGFRFAVFFFAGGAEANQMDIRFQRVSGLGGEVKTTSVTEGGQNLYTHRLPERVDYGNLVLERGHLVNSPLRLEFERAMSAFKFRPSHVMVTLLDAEAAPLSAWLFLKAFPVRWSTSDLDATEDKVVIDTLELAYTRMQPMSV